MFGTMLQFWLPIDELLQLCECVSERIGNVYSMLGHFKSSNKISIESHQNSIKKVAPRFEEGETERKKSVNHYE